MDEADTRKSHHSHDLVIPNPLFDAQPQHKKGEAMDQGFEVLLSRRRTGPNDLEPLTNTVSVVSSGKPWANLRAKI
jgi:hypothetical protein